MAVLLLLASNQVSSTQITQQKLENLQFFMLNKNKGHQNQIDQAEDLELLQLSEQGQ